MNIWSWQTVNAMITFTFRISIVKTSKSSPIFLWHWSPRASNWKTASLKGRMPSGHTNKELVTVLRILGVFVAHTKNSSAGIS